MTVAIKLDLPDRRARWLDKKRLTMREFADSLKLDYNTVFRWFRNARRPQRLYLEAVLAKYRDFPVK